jgi:hypothetical protein
MTKDEVFAELRAASRFTNYRAGSKVEQWLAGLSDPTLRDALNEAFIDTSINASAIYRLMRQHGFEGSFTGVRKHRTDAMLNAGSV